MAVMIDDDDFIDMLWERVGNFRPAENLPEEFWKAAFEQFKEQGWFSKPLTPSVIVDNIAVNGEVKELKEIRDNYTIPGLTSENVEKMSDDELEEYILENTDWQKVGPMFVKRWGF